MKDLNTLAYGDAMLDLETLGVTPGCAVLSIGAVAFNHQYKDEQALGPTYHRLIEVKSCLETGLVIDPNTVAWWEKQPPEARKTYLDAHRPRARGVRPPLAVAAEFNAWLTEHNISRVWGNGANFDQPILRAAFDAVDVKPVWSPFDERCYRTLKAPVPGPKLVREGTYHNALDDAVSQAKHAVQLLRLLSGPR